MIQPIADTHTHTLACDHAYSTVSENAAAAAARGLKFMALTEHTPSMPGAPGLIHFGNLRQIPRVLNGVVLLKGAEVNIMDMEGGLDLPNVILEKLEWVIASMHILTLKPGTVEEHTAAWMAVAGNPLVDVIGHSGDGRYPFELEPVIKEFARNGKIVEINAHSFEARAGSEAICPKIAKLCARHGVPVVISSDAHFSAHVGEFAGAVTMLEEIGFPEELVVNGGYNRFLAVAREKSGKTLTDEI